MEIKTLFVDVKKTQTRPSRNKEYIRNIYLTLKNLSAESGIIWVWGGGCIEKKLAYDGTPTARKAQTRS